MTSVIEDVIVSRDICSLQQLSVTQLNACNYLHCLKEELNLMYEIWPE